MTTVTGLGDSTATLLLSPLPSFALRHGLSRRGGCHRPPDEFRVINNFQRQRFLGAGHHYRSNGCTEGHIQFRQTGIQTFWNEGMKFLEKY